jgi:DnaJ family protein C protein 28
LTFEFETPQTKRCGVSLDTSKMDQPNPTRHEDEAQNGRNGQGRNWEGVVEKQIREAMERGEFDNLLGRGKPLDLSGQPHTPPEWELAFKLLRDAGFAPEWIEQDKEVRAAKTEIRKRFQNYLRRPAAKETDRSAAEARLIADFRKEARELNRLIDNFNLKAPSLRVHHTRIRVEEEIAEFRVALAKGRE